MTGPRVSIGLPVYNGENYLARALDSLLAQNYRDIEVIICDNASDDRTRDICLRYAARDPRVRYFRNVENIGAARNYNRTFHLATGEFFKWAAHDDWCAPAFLEQCVAVLDGDRRAVLCYTGTVYVDEEGSPLGTAPLSDFSGLGSPSPLRRGNRFLRSFRCTPPVFGLIRADALRRTQLFGSEVGADKILLMELIMLGPWRRIRDPLLYCFINKRKQGALRPRATGHKERRRALSTSTSRIIWWDPENARRLPLWRWRFLKRLVMAVVTSTAPVYVRLPLALEAIARCVRADHRQLLFELYEIVSQSLFRRPLPAPASGRAIHGAEGGPGNQVPRTPSRSA